MTNPKHHDAKLLDAMGEVVASMMKRDTLEIYRRERDEKIRLFDPRCTGHYAGCLAEGKEMISRLETRGYTVVKIEESNLL